MVARLVGRAGRRYGEGITRIQKSIEPGAGESVGTRMVNGMNMVTGGRKEYVKMGRKAVMYGISHMEN